MNRKQTSEHGAWRKSTDAEKALFLQGQEVLRQMDESLDAATLSRLQRARSAAIGSLDSGADRKLPRDVVRWSLLGASMATVLAVVLLLPGPGEQLPGNGDLFGDDVWLVTEDIQMIEDVDFYLWLAEGGVDGEVDAPST
ncbi:hypothetical protein [Biformimicrobium ophioploci]|nr:hypothetical protein [Microbulbifer sp. NKW57]